MSRRGTNFFTQKTSTKSRRESSMAINKETPVVIEEFLDGEAEDGKNSSESDSFHNIWGENNTKAKTNRKQFIESPTGVIRNAGKKDIDLVAKEFVSEESPSDKSPIKPKINNLMYKYLLTFLVKLILSTTQPSLKQRANLKPQ